MDADQIEMPVFQFIFGILPLTCGAQRAFIAFVTPQFSLSFYPPLFQGFAFVLGAIVGSFLNVVIYRLPLNMSVNTPRRSFCPHCKHQIPFHQNIPLFSWIVLRARCAKCGAKIPFRYFAVELLTALLFLAIWNVCLQGGGLALVLPLWVLASLLIAATFIDFDHFIIPDEITLGGTAAGLLFSFIFPSLMGAESHWLGLAWSLAGAVLGYGLLWGVVELGKLAFGKKKLVFNPPAEFVWTRKNDDAEFAVGEEKMLWSDIFSRESDLMIMEAKGVKLDEKPAGEDTLRFHYNRLMLPGGEVMLDTLDIIKGKVAKIVIPREAMGFGDVKFIACIGAFLGWKAVLFTVVAASVFGSLVGIALMITNRRDASGRIPFGPYLALGALLWIFAGPLILDWYWQFLVPPGRTL